MRGRRTSASNVSAEMSAVMGIESGDARNPNEPAKRVRRGMQQGLNLEVPNYEFDLDHFYYRWFSEVSNRPGRITSAQNADYEMCVDFSGGSITRPSGSSTMYLMRLKREFRIDDQNAKKEKNKTMIGEQTKIAVNQYAPTRTRAEGSESSLDRVESDNPYS